MPVGSVPKAKRILSTFLPAYSPFLGGGGAQLILLPFTGTAYCKGKKVNYTLVQALRLSTGRTAHKGSRGIALLLHDHGTRRR